MSPMASSHNETAPSRFQRPSGSSDTFQNKYLVLMHDFRRGEYGEYGVRTNPLAHAWFSCYSLEMRYGKVNLKPGVLISFQLFEVPFKLSTTLSI
jgi:hypothetical protein